MKNKKKKKNKKNSCLNITVIVAIQSDSGDERATSE